VVYAKFPCVVDRHLLLAYNNASIACSFRRSLRVVRSAVPSRQRIRYTALFLMFEQYLAHKLLTHASVHFRHVQFDRLNAGVQLPTSSNGDLHHVDRI
jgi:hypothetical protein